MKTPFVIWKDNARPEQQVQRGRWQTPPPLGKRLIWTVTFYRVIEREVELDPSERVSPGLEVIEKDGKRFWVLSNLYAKEDSFPNQKEALDFIKNHNYIAFDGDGTVVYEDKRLWPPSDVSRTELNRCVDEIVAIAHDASPEGVQELRDRLTEYQDDAPLVDPDSDSCLAQGTFPTSARLDISGYTDDFGQPTDKSTLPFGIGMTFTPGEWKQVQRQEREACKSLEG